MKKLLVALLLAASAGHSTITSIQLVASSTSCSSSSGTTCAVAVTSTTAGNVGVFCATTGTAGTTFTTPTAAGTWTLAGTAADNKSKCWYNLSLSAGVTSIDANPIGTSNNGRIAWFGEFHSSLGTWAFDAFATDNQTCTNCTGPTLTLSGTTDVILQLYAAGGNVSASTCANYSSPTATRAISNCLNVSSGTMNWTNLSGASQLTAVAMTESSGSSGSARRRSIFGDQIK